MSLYRARIAGTGSYLPEKVLTNKDLEKMVETNDQWIRERTGIYERHIAADNQATSDLSVIAAQKAMDAAGITAEEIDFIILGTVSPDQIMPNTACLVQEKLGCRNIGAIDISAACSGFVYGLSMAHQYIATGMYKNVLVIGAEVLSRIVDYTDRNTCILFGDGAGAMIISRAEDNEEGEVYSSHLHAQGSLGDLLEIKAGGSAYPTSQATLDEGLHNMTMKGKEIFKNAVRTMKACGEEALEHNKAEISEIDWIIPHQANERIIEAVAKQFGVSMDKVVVNVGHMGNTSAATVPIAFDEAVQEGKIKRGDKILLTAFGAGLTSGSALLTY